MLGKLPDIKGKTAEPCAMGLCLKNSPVGFLGVSSLLPSVSPRPRFLPLHSTQMNVNHPLRGINKDYKVKRMKLWLREQTGRYTSMLTEPVSPVQKPVGGEEGRQR